MANYRADADPAPSNVTPAPAVEGAPFGPDTFDAEGNRIEAVKPVPAPSPRETPEQEKERLEAQRKLQAAREASTLPSFAPAQSEESKAADEAKVKLQREQRDAAKSEWDEAGAAAPAMVPPSPATVSVQTGTEAEKDEEFARSVESRGDRKIRERDAAKAKANKY